MLTVVPPPAVTISQGQMSTQPVVGDFQVEYSALTVREHELDRKFQDPRHRGEGAKYNETTVAETEVGEKER